MIYLLYFLSFLMTVYTQCPSTDQDPNVEFVQLDKRNDVLVGENIAISSQLHNMPLVEPAIATHPLDEQRIVAAAMVVTDIQRPYESCQLSSFYSDDGGITWAETIHDYWGYDPWLAVLPNGQTVMSWLGTPQEFKHQFPLKVFNSKDAGKNWKPTVQSFSGYGHGHDGTKIVANNQWFYLTTVRFNGDHGADVVLYQAKSDGKFREVATIPGNGRRLNFCEPAILTDGTVLVPTMHSRGKIWINTYDPHNGELGDQVVLSEQPKLGRGYARMAGDVSSQSNYTDRTYFVRAVADGSSSKGVWLNFSKDKGKTWSKEKRIDLFDNGMKSKANVASVAVNNKGIIAISWVDGQEHLDQKKYDVYIAISKDGGISFQRPVRVTTVSSDPRTSLNGDVANKFIGGGHYLGLCAKPNGSFQLIWSDSRTGIFQLQTANVSVK